MLRTRCHPELLHSERLRSEFAVVVVVVGMPPFKQSGMRGAGPAILHSPQME